MIPYNLSKIFVNIQNKFYNEKLKIENKEFKSKDSFEISLLLAVEFQF